MENQSAGGSCCQQLAGKLEKSETGRKKLRQAIAMLKEKMEDTSKVLQVNESLRQECEKERKRADAERLKSETDRRVREKVEQESLTLKEQLIQVLKRLDQLEDHQKTDQSEIVRVHCMVKEAVDGVGGVLKAVEAAQSSFHTLERNLLAKVNGAVQSSAKVSSIAQREQSKVSAAETTALAAQAVAKTVQKEVQTLAAHVATLQKQSSSLTQQVSTLQLDSQLQGPRTPQDSLGSEETTTSLDITKKVKTSGAASPISLSLHSPLKIVLSKNQLQTDEVSKSQAMLTSVHPSPTLRNTSTKQVNTRVDSTPNVPTIPSLQAQVHRPRPGPVQKITGLQPIPNPSVNQTIPTSTAPSLYITAPSQGSQCFDRQGGNPVRKHSDVAKQGVITTKTKELAGRNIILHQQGELPKSKLSNDLASTHNDPAVSKRGDSQMGSQKQLKEFTRVVPETAPLPVEHSPGTVGEPIKEMKPDLPSKLFFSIASLLEKEKKTRSKMEEKFAELQDLLGNSSESFKLHSTPIGGKVGQKRKRDMGNEVAESVDRRKRHRGKKGARKDRVRKEKTSSVVCDPNNQTPPADKNGASDDHRSAVQAMQTEDRLIGGGKKNQFVPLEPGRDGLSGAHETIQKGLDGSEVRDAQGDLEPLMLSCLPSRNSLEGEVSLWDSDSEGTGDELGEAWWTSKNDLLSPTLPRILPCPLSPPSICLPPVQYNDGVYSGSSGKKKTSDDDGSKVSLNTVEPVAEGSVETSSGISIAFSRMQDCHAEEESLPISHSKGGSNMATGNQSTGEQLLPPNSCCMNLQEMSLFLEELPPVLQDVADNSGKGEWTIDGPQLGLEKGFCGTLSSPKMQHILQDCVAEDDNQRIVDISSSGDMPIEFQKGHTPANASSIGVLGTKECLGSKVALQHEHNATSVASDSEQLSILQEPAIERLVAVKNLLGPMQTKDFEKAETITTIQKLEGALFGREAISGSTAQDAIEDCEIKRTVIESHGLVKTPTQHGGSGVSHMGQMVSTPDGEKLKLMVHSEDCRDIDRNWGALKPSEEPLGLHFDIMCAVEPNCKQAGRSHGNQPLLQEEAQAFIAIKDSLHEALVGGTTCKLQRGKDLRKGLAAIALQFNLSGEDILSLLSLVLVEVPALWQLEGALEAVTSRHLSFQNLHVQLVELVDEVLLNTEGLLMIPANFQAVNLLLVQLQRVLIEGKAETCGIGSAETLPSSGLTQMTVRKRLWEVHGCACQDGTIENARTGAKIFAGLCQAHGRLDFLQDSMYTILHRSYNNCWLLAMISSFASICGRTVFPSGSEMATQAVCAIVSELLCDRYGNISEQKMESCSKSDSRSSPAPFHLNMMEEELEVLQNCLVGENMPRLKILLPKLLQSLHQLLISPMCIISSMTLQCPRLDETFTLDNAGVQTRPFVTESVVETKDDDHVEISRTMLVEKKAESQVEKQGSGQEDNKLTNFLDMCRALELVAIHLGWKWTYNELLVEHLWSTVAPGAPEVTVIHLAYIVGILGRLGIMEDGEELPGVQQLRNQLHEVLQGAFTEPAKVAAAQALSHLKSSHWNCPRQISPEDG